MVLFDRIDLPTCFKNKVDSMTQMVEIAQTGYDLCTGKMSAFKNKKTVSKSTDHVTICDYLFNYYYLFVPLHEGTPAEGHVFSHGSRVRGHTSFEQL